MRGRVDRGADPGDDGRLLAVVAGSLTRDRILVEGHEAETRIGGAVWYAGRTLQALGCHLRAVYRRAECDSDLDEALAEAGLTPRPEPAARTTRFTLRYRGEPPSRPTYPAPCSAPSPRLDARLWNSAAHGAPRHWPLRGPVSAPLELAELAAPERAEPIGAAAVVAAAAGCALLYLGPLHPEDLDASLWPRLPVGGPWIALDLQGLCRRVEPSGRIVPAAHASAVQALAVVDVVKANAGEAALLTGAADALAAARTLARACRGGEAVVTLGAEGALAATRERLWHVPAEPLPPVEATGAGDTCFAAYLARRLEGATPEQALWFAVRYTARRLAARVGTSSK